MRKERISPSISYLIELAVAILFFAAAAVICVNIFYQANQRSIESEERSAALEAAQSMAEQAIASKDRVPVGTWNANAKWQPTDIRSEYRISIRERAADKKLFTYELQMRKSGKSILTLEFTVLCEGGVS
ncbi:MAG: hypothetical protein KH431_03575 [Erysipelotrichaceae bacterium]|uniref:Type II secretion system protein n=1 Tax=Copranaerobaculum intestinale TaxID=2692629 RepID=A0A6N8U8K9_9FIRM|nr:hypothetical protein [Copranaerobaculum intestinale]MBS6373683.1 hypothetical protein [Erysipelotrichaceae bacterium]MXQ74536.1 hypothetical protein [Copranaerobaculum intestinale]